MAVPKRTALSRGPHELCPPPRSTPPCLPLELGSLSKRRAHTGWHVLQARRQPLPVRSPVKAPIKAPLEVPLKAPMKAPFELSGALQAGPPRRPRLLRPTI